MLFRKKTQQRSGGITLGEWAQYCDEVATAARTLWQLASRAQGEAFAASVHNNGLGRAAQEFGYGHEIRMTNPHAETHATAMLGAFAAIEGLRRRLNVS